MNRTALGLIALSLLVVGALAAWRGPPDGSAAGFAGGCIRVGLVLGALWLALPQITGFFTRAPRWLLTASAIAVVVCAVKPILLVFVVPLLGLLWFLGPKMASKADKPIIEARRPRRRSNSRGLR
jgi:hypothetical protein